MQRIFQHLPNQYHTYTIPYIETLGNEITFILMKTNAIKQVIYCEKPIFIE